MTETTNDRKPTPGSTSWYQGVSTASPWGYVWCGVALIVIGIAIFAISSVNVVSEIELATNEYAEQEVGAIIGRFVGLGLMSLGLIFSLVGAVAEGVRIGTLYARPQ